MELAESESPPTSPPQPARRSVRVGILTVSDRASRGETEDLSGPLIQEAFSRDGYIVAVYACIPDDRKQITRTLRRWADEDLCDCILTTGGTGLTERDVTPEATVRVLDQELPHLATHLALQGVKTVPTAVLSRGVAGARGKTLIVNLPGSPDGAKRGAKLLVPIVAHAVQLLSGLGEQSHQQTPSAGEPSSDPSTPSADADTV